MTSENQTSFDNQLNPHHSDGLATPVAGSPMGLDEASRALENKGRRILVVDSDIENADLLVALMENEGYSVEVATDGNYALMLADKFEPQLILLGLDLPGMSGPEVAHILHTEPRYAQRFRFTRIFYVTGKDLMIQKRFDSLPGTPMSDYIFTPIDIPELLEKVSRAFGDQPSSS
ncbi:MAG TPA: response regulator [Abditibacteriaceae bacterium]|jgi:CheY-like chemotaxis protein